MNSTKQTGGSALWKAGIAALAVMIIALAGCDTAGDDTSGNSGAVTFVIKSEADVNAAKAKIAENGDGTETNYKAYTLDIQADVVVTEVIKFWAFNFIELPVEYITITVLGNKKLTQSSNNAALFSISGNQKLIIDSEGLTLEGNEENFCDLVEVSFGGRMELKKGTLTGNSGGGVKIDHVWQGSMFTMSGGSITGNMGVNGTGVSSPEGGDAEATPFIMTGGTISNNGSSGVYIFGSSFPMSGGTISGNGSSGVLISGEEGSFTMSGGTISGNSSNKGGGVYVDNGTFAKTGGVIYGYDSGNANNPLWNKANNGSDTWGHAVFYEISSSNQYYRDTTLAAGDNISTGSVPSLAAGSYDATNWIKKP